MTSLKTLLLKKQKERKNASFKTPEGALLAALGIYGGRDELTDDQKHVYDEAVPFFKREAKIVDGLFRLEYRVHSTEVLDTYEPHADDIIREGKILGEFVDIYLSVPGEEINLALVTTYFDSYPNQEDDTCVDINITKESLEKMFEGTVPGLAATIDSSLKSLKESAQGPYDASRTYRAVVDFFLNREGNAASE